MNTAFWGLATLAIIALLIAIFVITNLAIWIISLPIQRSLQRSYRRMLAAYPGIYRVVRLPNPNCIFLRSSSNALQIGDFGWQAEPVYADGRIYLHGLNESWQVVWYAGFEAHEVEFVGLKPDNQYGRREWHQSKSSCPFIVQEAPVSSARTFGLPLERIGKWIQGKKIEIAKNEMTLIEKFNCLLPEMNSTEVQKILGTPDSLEESCIPIGSGFGTQDTFRIKIREGEEILQWVYNTPEQDLVIWFAKRNHQWLLSAKLKAPKHRGFS